MLPELEHSPDEHGGIASRTLRPFTPAHRPMPVSRRNFLRGTGVLMALPFLESLPAWAQETTTTVARPKYPQRLAAIFVGNGINSKHWWAKGAGETMEF